VGRAKDSRRITEARNRDIRTNGLTFDTQTRKAPISDLANLPQQPPQRTGVDRFFTVPTATFRVLFVLVVLAHHRRRVMHFNVTEHPTAAWTAQQIIEAFPDETAPRFL